MWLIFLSAMPLVTGFQKTSTNRSLPGFAVVELFTSEGCSSCPPADEAVKDIAGKYKLNVFVLGFHVDYWNYLGWKDPFSKPDYSERQKQYALIFSLNTIYTPQIIVNGKTEFVGSDKNKLEETVTRELKMVVGSPIQLYAKEERDNEIEVKYNTEKTQGDIINIALVQVQAENNISEGENEGKVLHHINAVRDFKIGELNGSGPVLLHFPAGLSKKDCKIIAFLQDKKTMRILSAASADIY
ncbi:MAG TPA: DUF1223 domain-containing protein [Puia sp.]|nr:DUF1223 domain-containing protein [Puia sp.]